MDRSCSIIGKDISPCNFQLDLECFSNESLENEELARAKLGAEAHVDFTRIKDVAQEILRVTDGKGAPDSFVSPGKKSCV